MQAKKNYSNLGFTLIEIIAVLVILGILAAVAVPRYIDLQGEAKKKSAYNLIAAAQSAVSLQFSRNLLETASADTAWNDIDALDVCANNISQSGYDDYTLACNKADDEIEIKVTWGAGNELSATFSKPVPVGGG